LKDNGAIIGGIILAGILLLSYFSFLGNTRVCDICGENEADSSVYVIDEELNVCENCRYDALFCCDGCGEWYYADDIAYCDDDTGELYCEWCYEEMV
jgi:hypothetical protein